MRRAFQLQQVAAVNISYQSYTVFRQRRAAQHSAKSCSLNAPPPTHADLMGTTTGPSPSQDAGEPGEPGSPSTQADMGSAARSAAYATTSNVQPADAAGAGSESHTQ